MNSAFKVFAIAVLCATVSAPASFAQDHQDHHDDHAQDHHDSPAGHGGYVHHNDWQKGHKMAPNDWARGQRIDYRTYHLNAPPRGYEWRSVDGNYVLAAVATGLISSVVIASAIH